MPSFIKRAGCAAAAVLVALAPRPPPPLCQDDDQLICGALMCAFAMQWLAADRRERTQARTRAGRFKRSRTLRHHAFETIYWANCQSGDTVLHMRFTKPEILRLRLVFFPNTNTWEHVLISQYGHRATTLILTCAFLYRYARPRTLYDLSYFFGISDTVASYAVKFMELTVKPFLSLLAGPQHLVTPPQVTDYMNAIIAKRSRLTGRVRAFALVDGTVRPIARPGPHQRSFFNGHKWRHSINFLTVVLPNGIIWKLDGPYEGHLNDKRLVQLSDLSAQVRTIQDSAGPLVIPVLYADGGFTMSRYMVIPFRTPTAGQLQWNVDMGGIRTVVEWTFGNVLTKAFQWTEYKHQNQLLRDRPGLKVKIAFFLYNVRTCLRGRNPTSDYFSLQPPSLDAYLAHRTRVAAAAVF
eukprot:m.15594 g.15594  ORF g.15594 m.15594 type:complete len:409 (+) comp8543_c0_seq1:240-1466(+)